MTTTNPTETKEEATSSSSCFSSCCSLSEENYIVFLGLYCYQTFKECFRFHRPEHLKDKPLDVCAYVQVFAAKFLLEVLGAGGAVWGSSEVLTVRNAQNSDRFWRPVALGVALIFAQRFWWQSKHFLEHEREFPPIKRHHRRLHRLPFVQIFASKFVLEVCGSAGACWGFSEVVTLRNYNTLKVWHFVAATVGVLFLIRWIIQIFSYCLCLASWSDDLEMILTKVVRWFELLVVKLILEVFGAAGAVWGFSEIVKLRTPETLAIWRPVAFGVGFLFCLRWLWHVRCFLKEEWQSPTHEDPVDPEQVEHSTAEAEDVDAQLNDLELSVNPAQEANPDTAKTSG